MDVHITALRARTQLTWWGSRCAPGREWPGATTPGAPGPGQGLHLQGL